MVEIKQLVDNEGDVYPVTAAEGVLFSDGENLSEKSFITGISVDGTTQTVTDGVVDLSIDSAPTNNSTNLITSGGVYTGLSGKQDSLVSGTSIKTINNETLLGSGNITINADTSACELLANKVTTISSSSTDTQYPSAKCMYDTVGDIELALDIIINGSSS